MKANSTLHAPHSTLRSKLPRWTCALAALGLAALPASAWQLTSNLTFRAEASVKEGYDDNVYLQDTQPNLTLVPKAALPYQGSFFTTLTPALFLDYQPSPAFNLSASYVPAISFYYSTPSENNTANKMALNLGGNISTVGWELANSLLCIAGSREGLYYGGAPTVGGNVPAIGGIPVRDRRAATMYRGRYRATWYLNQFFVRPVTTAYVHDFNTVSKDNRLGQPNYGYENYVDRWEYAGGVDLGYELPNKVQIFLGYRRGFEDDSHMPGSPYNYDTKYNRPLAGIEGQPWPWFKVALALGWDMHQTTSRVPIGFDQEYAKLWSDSSLSFLPTARDTFTFRFTSNTQPAFSSPSIYDDTQYDLSGRHVFSPHWAAGAGVRLYNGDWFYPVLRNDWVYTASASLAYTYNAHLSTELTYSYDWTDCRIPQIPDTSGREFNRNLFWLAVKWSL